MDSTLASSSSTPPGSNATHHHASRTSSNQTIRGQGVPLGDNVGEPLRRGHSDGDVLAHTSNQRRHASTENVPGERETWMDFIRDSSGDASGDRRNTSNRARLAAGRLAIMDADRRERLAEHQEERLRRRASSNLSSISPLSGWFSGGSMKTPGDPRYSGAVLPPNAACPSTPRITNRPLPRPPDIGPFQDRRSRDITLPEWQSDADVSKCPICGTAFSFWYRKHHCRKCGRVVCGNCSPHRITIPRQFIVHPPEEAAVSPSTARTTGVEVVDLTEDNDSSDETSQPNLRPQSSDYRIDSALGGGQEVRLCNPCVPDPNPLPHLPFSGPDIDSRDSFQTPERVFPHRHRFAIPGLTSSGDERPADVAGSSPSSPNTQPNNLLRFNHSMASRQSFAPPNVHTLNSQLRTHAPRPGNPPTSPPGYSTIYGSAPDQTARQVSRIYHGIIYILTNQSVTSQLFSKIVQSTVIIVTMRPWGPCQHCLDIGHRLGMICQRHVLRYPDRNFVKRTNVQSVTGRCLRKDQIIRKVTAKPMSNHVSRHTFPHLVLDRLISLPL